MFMGMNGFLVDIVGPAGDIAYGQTDNYYDPCLGSRVTVGVGTKLPVVIRASGGVVVKSGQPVDLENLENNVVQVTAQNVSVSVSQPGGASNPVRQDQPVTVNQPQTIAVVPLDKSVLEEFAKGSQNAGVTVLSPKVVDPGEAIKSGILLKDGANVIGKLSQQIAVEVEVGRQTAAILSQADDVVINQVAGQMMRNRQNIFSILSKSGVDYSTISNITNAALSNDEALVQKLLQGVKDKVPQITKNLGTAAQNVAVSSC